MMNFISDQAMQENQARDIPGTTNLYHTIIVPKWVLGFRKDKKVVKWNPYRDLSALQYYDISEASGPGYQNPGHFKDEEGKFHTSDDAAKDATRVLDYASRKAPQGPRPRDPDTGERKSIDETTLREQSKQLLAKASKDLFDNVDDTDGQKAFIDFIYFGDIAQVALGRMYKVRKYFSSEGQAFNNLYAGSGPSKESNKLIEDFKSSIKEMKKTIEMDVDIADIPIVSKVFTDFVIKEVVMQERYTISAPEFIIALFRHIMYKYFNDECFRNEDLRTMFPEIKFFDLVSYKKDRKISKKGIIKGDEIVIPAGENHGTKMSSGTFKDRMKKYEGKLASNKSLSRNPNYHFCYLGAQGGAVGSNDILKDRANNIHHFYIGRDRGIVKKIEFTSKEIEGRAEAVWSAMGNSLEKAMFMIPRIYDVTVTLIGNNLFESGQTFYVNPTLGTTLYGGKDNLDIVKNTGLGGYYYISKVETVIKEGEYETKLHGTKIYLAESETKKAFNSASKVPGADKMIEQSQTQLRQNKQLNVLNVSDNISELGKLF